MRIVRWDRWKFAAIALSLGFWVLIILLLRLLNAA